MLPAFAVPLACNFSKNPYVTGNATVDAKLAFAAYFESTWVNGAFDPHLWTDADKNVYCYTQGLARHQREKNHYAAAADVTLKGAAVTRATAIS